MKSQRRHFGSALVATVIALSGPLAFVPSVSATSYGYTPFGTTSVDTPARYVDTLSDGNNLIGLGEALNNENAYVQAALGAIPAFGDRLDLGLGANVAPLFTRTSAFAVADIDGDGQSDIALKYSDMSGTYLSVDYSSPDHKNFTVRLSAPNSTCNSSMGSVFGEAERGDAPVIGDINHDGLVDITVISGCSVFSYDEDGMANIGWPLINREYHTIALADLNGDSYTDLLISSESLLQAVRGDGTEIWHKDYAAHLYYPAIGDVMGDSQPEIVVSDGGLTVLGLDGSMKFSESFTAGSATPHSTIRLSDIDGDGKLDLVTEMGGFVTGGSRIYAYTLLGSKAILSGFPVQLPGNISRGGILTANVTKSVAGNDILVPTDSGLVVIGHQSPGILYTIQPGHDISQVILGSTDGTNFVAMANIGTTNGGAMDVETFGFTAGGAASILGDQNSLSMPAQNHDSRRTNSFTAIPLRIGAAVHRAAADIDRDGRVGIYDLSKFLRQWNLYGPGDFNGDGSVDITDLSIMLSSWTG